MTLRMRRLVAPLARLLCPGVGWCHRCRRPWTFAREHLTTYDGRNGCFPLCEACWRELSPAERLPFYRQLWEEWERTTTRRYCWADIEAAVLSGR